MGRHKQEPSLPGLLPMTCTSGPGSVPRGYHTRRAQLPPRLRATPPTPALAQPAALGLELAGYSRSLPDLGSW